MQLLPYHLIQWFMSTEEQKSYHLDYGEHTLVCPHSCANEVTCVWYMCACGWVGEWVH